MVNVFSANKIIVIVMICLLCNGDGSIGVPGGGGGRGQHYNPSVVRGGGSTSKYKLGQGGSPKR